MAETITLDPAAVAGTRTALDITAWVDADGPDWGDAAISAYMSEAGLGQLPVDYRVPNRTVTIPLNIRTVGATSFATFRLNLQAKAGLFQREGGWLSRQTAVGTVYANVVNASLRLGGDWYQANRSFDTQAVLTLECLPDFYRAEITLDDMVETTSAEIARVLQLSSSNASVKGDYPGRVRIVVDDDQGQAQLGLLWAFRCRNYSSAVTAALKYEAEALTPLDTAAVATVTGASGGVSNNVVRHANLATSWTPVLSTQMLAAAHLTHTGSYRVWARVYSTSATPPKVRLSWDVGDLLYPVENALWTIPGANNFYIADFGEIRLDQVPAGTHRWQGIFQGKGAAGGENVSIDKIWFQPFDEGAGVLRAPITADAGLVTYSARDEFNQTAGALAGKTLPVGGTWAGAGDADDFTLDTGTHVAQRTAVSDAAVNAGRFGLAGTGTPTLTALSVDVAITSGSGTLASQGLFARYTDTNNFVTAWVGRNDGQVSAWQYVAGTPTVLGQGPEIPAHVGSSELALTLLVTATGVWAVWVNGLLVVQGQSTALATGGTLASGRFGIFDLHQSSDACTRTYDNFAAWVPSLDAVLHPSQSAELRWDGMVREDAAGAAYGPVSHVTGDLPRLPPSGLEGRPVELFLKASRGDFDQLPDTGIDDLSARAGYWPSLLFVPDA